MSTPILRITTLDGIASARSALQRAYLEIPALPDEAYRTGLGIPIIGLGSVDALSNLMSLLPDTNTRADTGSLASGVLIEYELTASPAWWDNADEDLGGEFVLGALEWVRNKHGMSNVVAGMLRIEMATPTLFVYVVPIAADGRLSASAFVGGAEQQLADHASFARMVETIGMENVNSQYRVKAS